MHSRYTSRPLSLADGTAWERLVPSFDLEDRPVTRTTAAEFTRLLTSGQLEAEYDTMGVFHNGTMIGFKDLHVGYIGTPPGARGRDLHRSLLPENDRMARGAGCTGTAFSVNTANPTGALRLFQFIGVDDPKWDRSACWVCYRKDITAVTLVEEVR